MFYNSIVWLPGICIELNPKICWRLNHLNINNDNEKLSFIIHCWRLTLQSLISKIVFQSKNSNHREYYSTKSMGNNTRCDRLCRQFQRLASGNHRTDAKVLIAVRTMGLLMSSSIRSVKGMFSDGTLFYNTKINQVKLYICLETIRNKVYVQCLCTSL